MPNTSFRFKTIEIFHDRCAMKVGTDGVLLGAWADFASSRKILDVGTGSGLIAMMAYRRNPDAEIVGIELDAQSAEQAVNNVVFNGMSDRISIVCADFLSWPASDRFDHIVCNPPFYSEDTRSPDAHRARARHTSALPPELLVRKASYLLSPAGAFSVVLSKSLELDFISFALSAALHLHRRTRICTVEGKAPKRVLLSFARSSPERLIEEALCLYDRQGRRTPAFIHLTHDFYLD